MRTIRNVFRRKMRAVLTISGITIGVFALIVMGAMAEKITLLVDGGLKWTGDKVTISSGDEGMGGFSSQPLSVTRVKELERVAGVAAASASIGMMLDETQSAMSMGMPPMIVGSDGRGEGYETFQMSYSSGRKLRPNDRGKVTVGADLVKRLHAEVGKTVTIRDEEFEVVGIMEKTLTAPDSSVYVSMYDAQELFKESLPAMVKSRVDVHQLATGITVFVKPGQDPERVADRINDKFDDLKAAGPAVFKKQIGDSTKIFTSIIFGIALISLLVGGLSVVNTMTMAVGERTREIGIRKAIGASDGTVMGQFVGESAVIAVTGGLVGLALGAGFVSMANANAADTPLFLLTARLVLGSLGFALFLGVLSGMYPAWRASRLNPVVALRYE